MKMQPVLKETKDIEILKDCYLNKKMSTPEISKQSNTLFGFSISKMSVYTALKRNYIPIRNKSESISLATRIENYDTSYLTEDMIEWFDGFLLGDGSIRFNNKDVKNSGTFTYARITMGSVKKEWTEYAISKFKPYAPRELNKLEYENNPKNPNPLWTARTIGHPDITIQAKRWYPLPDCKKIVPQDVRITPTSVMLWYLGDGSLSNNKNVKLATCGFTDDENSNILIPKLEEVGIYSYLSHWKQYGYICIRRNSIGKFFKFIGETSPIKCYDYKFKYNKFYSYNRICDIVKDKREMWRAQWFCKNDKIEYTTSDKFFLFTNEQAIKLRERLNKTNKTYFAPDKIQTIIDMYEDKISLAKISIAENSTVKIIRRVLLENNIKLRAFSEINRKYYFNENFFSNGIINENAAYLFGYLLADGYNGEKRSVVEINTSITDIELFEKIKAILNSNHKIQHYIVKDKKYCRLSLNSKIFSQDLAKLGCIQNKSFLINFTDFGERLQNHFIRGFFDGDGCISYSFAKRDNCYGNSFLSVITFTSTENFCLGLQKYIMDNLNINSTILCRFPERNNCVRTLQISGNTQVKTLRDWMYNNSTVYLNRKLNKFLEIENILKDRNNDGIN